MLKTLIETVKGAKEQIAHYGESVIDLAVDNETWENIPLVEHATKILSIRDVYRKNKIKRNYAAFILAAGSMNYDEAQSFLDKLTSQEPIAEEVSETIFDVIVEAQKPIKAEVLGRLAVALAKGFLSLEDYNTLALMVHSCSVASLNALPQFIQGNDNKLYLSKPRVLNEGLLFSLGVGTRHGNMFRIDERGRQLAEYGFNLNINT